MTKAPIADADIGDQAKTLLFTIDWRNRDETNGLISTLATLPARLVIIVNDPLPLRYETPQGAALSIEAWQTDKNLGFAAACNLALRAAKSRGFTHIAHLNNDLRVPEPYALAEYIAQCQRSGVAMSSPTVVTEGGAIEFAGSSLLSRLSPAIIHSRSTVPEEHGFHETLFVDGACFTLDVAAANSVGGFHERYFAYREEHDLSARLRRAGYRISYYSSATVVHRTSATASKIPYFKRFLMTRGQILYGQLNVRGLPAVLYWTIVLLKHFAIVLKAGASRPEQLRAILDATRNTLGNRSIALDVYDETIEF